MRTLVSVVATVTSESMEEALDELVRALGGSKAVGARLWPEKAPDDAGRLLRHCIDPDRAEKLSIDQLVLLLRWGREARCHVATAYLLRVAGYREPVPVTPDDERAALQAEFISAVSAMQRIVRRMDGAGVKLQEAGDAA